MTTLAVDSPQVLVGGDMGSTPIIAADIVYEGAMIGDNGAGYGRPLVAGDKFLGHNIEQVDNTLGAAGAKNIRHRTGKYRMVCNLVGLITDVGQPVYASDDATLSMYAGITTTKNSYVGKIVRYESATKMEIEFETCGLDEFDPNPNRVVKADDYTTVDTDNGKIIYLGVDAKTITLLATVAGYRIRIVNSGGLGVAGIIVDFNAADKSLGGCGLAAGGDGAAITNTKATAQRGDFLELLGDGTAGWNVVGKRGIWVQA
jgi:hypothetical protein